MSRVMELAWRRKTEKPFPYAIGHEFADIN